MTYLEKAIAESKKHEHITLGSPSVETPNIKKLGLFDLLSHTDWQIDWEPRWRELFERALKTIDLMAAMAGHPSPEEACRNVIAQAKHSRMIFEALAKQGLENELP